MVYRAVCGVLLLALTLCSCNQQALIQKFVRPAQDKAARGYLEDIRAGNFGPFLAAVDPAYQGQITPGLLKNIQALFGSHSVRSITVVGAQTSAQKLIGRPSIALNSLTYEYDMGDRSVVANIVLQDIGNAMQIEGIHVQPLATSLERANAFTFSGKNAAFYVFFALALLIPLFILATEVFCWRTPIPRHKWPWRIFILLGVTGFTLNWTSGDVQFLPLHIDLLGVGYAQQPYGPLILQIGIPLGAILFWIRRRKWLDQAEEEARHFS